MSRQSNEGRSDDVIWRYPLLILAGIAGLAGVLVGVAVWRGSIPEPIGPALQWGLAGASLTFTIARIVHARGVGRRELELLVLGAGILVAHYFLLVAAVVVGIAVVGLLIEELS